MKQRYLFIIRIFAQYCVMGFVNSHLFSTKNARDATLFKFFV